MASESKSSKGAPSSAGKRKGKFDRYFANSKEKKIRNVRKHNGKQASAAYKDWLFEHRVTNAAADFNRSMLKLPKETKGAEVNA